MACKQNQDSRCVLILDPGTVGAGAKTRLESRIKKCTPHCVFRYGMKCTAQYKDDNGCGKKDRYSRCDENDGGTSDMICQCAPADPTTTTTTATKTTVTKATVTTTKAPATTVRL